MFPFKKILCPTDFSEPSYCGIRMANEMATKFGSEVTLLNVHKPIQSLPSPRIEATEMAFDVSAMEERVTRDATESLAALSAKLLDETVATNIIVRLGNPADQILQVADEEGVEAIFIATHGRRGISHMVFGSVAEKVVRQAHCPVLTIRACDKE